jgi:hypothetical protein
MLAVPVAAVAASGSGTTTTGTAVKTLKRVAVSGTSRNGKKFTGHFTIDRFTSKNGKAYAVGTLVGKVGNRHVTRQDVSIPVGVQRSGSATTAATCPILHLVLGPLNLNLLGLHVHLNQVVLDITATSGPGQLLGNLLCGVANLLNGQSLLAQETAGLLNIIQQLLNVPTLGGL